MPNIYLVSNDDGTSLDARFHIEGLDMIFHSRGGTKGRDAKNSHYSEGLCLVLQRLQHAGVPVHGAWVDSRNLQSMPLESRRVLNRSESHLPAPDLARLISARMTSIRAIDGVPVKGGNGTKRIRIGTEFQGREGAFVKILGGVPTDASMRDARRLPVEDLRKATPQFIWRAVQELLSGQRGHVVEESTDYDLIANEADFRLPPKAVFGVALTHALGYEVLPGHFSAGTKSPCFRLLQEAGFEIVPKGQPRSYREEPPPDPEETDEWTEGAKKLVKHLKR